MLAKKISLTISIIVFALCCIYGSSFCAFNSVNVINNLLWDMPFRKLLLNINDGSLGILFYVCLMCVIACITITVLTKTETLSIGLWSFVVLFIIIFITLPYKEWFYPFIAIALIVEAIYSIIVLIRNINKKEF